MKREILFYACCPRCLGHFGVKRWIERGVDSVSGKYGRIKQGILERINTSVGFTAQLSLDQMVEGGLATPQALLPNCPMMFDDVVPEHVRY